MSDLPEYVVLAICWLVLVGTVYALSWAALAEEHDLMEEGRRLASEREDLIARGADPTELPIPLAPLDEGDDE